MVEEGKDGAKEHEIRKAEKQALHVAIDHQLEQREGRMTEAILQGDTGKLWGLITAAIEHGFIHHLGLNREDASKMRGRSVVRIKTNDPLKTSGGDVGKVRAEPRAIDRKNKKKRWLSRAGKHSMQASRLINVARRMQAMSSVIGLAKGKINEGNNADTLAAYFKDAARLMRPSKDIVNKKDKEEERKDGVGKLLQEMLTLDPLNPIHAAKAFRAVEKHKAIASI